MQVYLKEVRMFWHYVFLLLICHVVDRDLKSEGHLSDAMSFIYAHPFLIFIACSILSYLIIAIQMYRKEAVNRLVLGLSLFVSVGSIAWLNNISSVLYYYDNYERLLPFAFIIGVGLSTMIFTQAGFVGALSDDKRSVRIASLKLFVASILAALFSFYYLIFILPMLFLAIYDWKLRRDIQGGSGKPWKFKW